MTYYLYVSNEPTPDKKEDLTQWEEHLEGDCLEDLEGYVCLCLEKTDHELYKFKHMRIGKAGADVKDTGSFFMRYWFQHIWLPSNQVIRLCPPPDELKDLIEQKRKMKTEQDTAQSK